MTEPLKTDSFIRRAKAVFLNLILMFAVVYGALVVLLYFGQNRLLYFPVRQIYQTPSAKGWSFEDLRLSVGEETTAAWYVHTEGARRGVVLFSHGNAGNMADRLESIGVFRDLGLDVLIYDYGGYGESSGKPSEPRLYDDIRAAWRYLIEERKIAPDEIVLFGRSLGAGPTCQLATEVQPAAVVIESAFRSVPAMARELYPWLPVRLLARTRLDNEAKIAKLEAPLLVVHSPDDSIIPYSHGERLFELAPNPKSFLKIHGDHNEGFWESGELYTGGLESFLDPLFRSED